MLGVFVFTFLFIVETPRPRGAPALVESFAGLPALIKDAGRLALRHRALSVLLAALACFLMATNPVEVLWPTHAKPMLEASYANTAIGFLTAAYFLSIAFGASISPYVSRLFRRRQEITLAAAFACLSGLQIALALQEGIIGFAAAFILYSVVLGLTETPASTILHRCVADIQRSTMLSLRSLVQQLGGAIGLVLAGAIADMYSAPIAWMVISVFLAVAVILVGVLALRLSAKG
ncbi:MAG: MFS transporter, partial [Pseudomonadota bacterium]